MPITFPNLGIEVSVSPVAFSIGSKDVYWYGILITAGIVLALFLAWKNRKNLTIQWDTITDFLIIAIPIGVICARLYYVIFRWENYSQNLSEIFKIWHGGMAIYGAVIGGIVTAFVFCKKKKISFLSLCDDLAPYLALCQSIGRWGNFINQEAYGQITNSFFKMGIYQNATHSYIYVQPTFLYESVCTFLLFLLLSYLTRHKKFQGQIFYSYMIGYGIVRAVIEGFRSDSLYIGNFRVSQILSILFSTIFAIIFLLSIKKRKKEVESVEKMCYSMNRKNNKNSKKVEK